MGWLFYLLLFVVVSSLILLLYLAGTRKKRKARKDREARRRLTPPRRLRSDLKGRFSDIKPLVGKTKAEIISAVGRPDNERYYSARKVGRTYYVLQWRQQDGKYNIELDFEYCDAIQDNQTFDSEQASDNDICSGISSERIDR